MADQLHRQDAPIWNAIEAGNYKQAHKLVDKRLAKKPTDYLEALKIFIRSKSTLLSEKAAVVLNLEELPSKKLIFKDLETIQVYEEAFGEVFPGLEESWAKIIGEIRWQCVKSSPKDEEISLDCFKECLAHHDIDHARQIANSLEKNFPGNHAYLFWNITTMFLYSVTVKYPDNQRILWGTLAFATIQKLANATKDAADPTKLSIRSIHTPQELLLLHNITDALGKPEQRLEYLRDPNLGPESVVAKGEWQLWRIRLTLLKTAHEWKELFNVTRALLKRARTKDGAGQLSEANFSDWIVWDAFICSATELGGDELRQAVISEVEAHLEPNSGVDKSWRRNASLAKVTVLFKEDSPFSLESSSETDRLDILQEYLIKYGSATTTYDDLRSFVERLKDQEKKSLLQRILGSEIFGNPFSESDNYKTSKKVTEHVNAYKLRYLISFSIPAHNNRQRPTQFSGQAEFTCLVCGQKSSKCCTKCLKDFAVEVAKLYLMSVEGGRKAWNLLPTDRHPADDLVVLAAMSLITLSKFNDQDSDELLSKPNSFNILQATALLEYAASFSESNFQIRLLLVRLYQYLGDGLHAMWAFDHLALKQIQLDTLSYVMLDGISSLHPHGFCTSGETHIKAPVEQFKKQQKMIRGAFGHINRNTWLSYKHGSYNTVFELQEVSDKLGCTLASVMSVVETMRINRLIPSGEPTNCGLDILPANFDSADSNISDTNDYSTFPNFETSLGASFEELSRHKPGPNKTRARINVNNQHLAKLLLQPPNALKAESEAYLKEFLRSPPAHLELNEPPILISDIEDLARICHEEMTHIIVSNFGSTQWDDANFQTTLGSSNANLISRLEQALEQIKNLKAIVPAFADVLQLLYTTYDLVLITLAFCKFLGAKDKKVHSSQAAPTAKILALCQELQKVIAEKATVVKKGLDEGGWIDKVLDSVNGADGQETVIGELGYLVDAGRLEVWAGDLVEGWKDSCEGLMLLKVVE